MTVALTGNVGGHTEEEWAEGGVLAVSQRSDKILICGAFVVNCAYQQQRFGRSHIDPAMTFIRGLQ